MRLNPFAKTNIDREEDYGFGEKLSGQGIRLLNKDGTFNVKRTGSQIRFAYQWLIEMDWWKFFAAVLAYYVAINFVLALITFAADPKGIQGIEPGLWYQELIGCFFFSVQTFTTVGYGSMAPVTLIQQIIAALGALVGLMSLALATGLFFARFSRPRDLILFSDAALITPYRDGSGFLFRIANRASTKLINVSAIVVYSWVELNSQGNRKRKFAQLPLERDEISMFPLNWTIVHPITQDSPLYEIDKPKINRLDGEFIVQINGYDETYARPVYAHTSYRAECIITERKFAPMYHHNSEGHMVLELDKIDVVEEISI